MSASTEVVIIGTGLASLIAARLALEEGLAPLILNPDDDFFREGSELPLAPLVGAGGALTARAIAAQRTSGVADLLRPHYPGALELWSEGVSESSYRNPRGPFLRSRQWVWLSEEMSASSLADMERLFVELSDQGLSAQWLDGLLALRRFPGFSVKRLNDKHSDYEHHQALLVPGLADLDVERYRTGLLEFLRERLGPERVVSSAGPIELLEEGIRYSDRRSARVVQPTQGTLVFWTPRLSQWVENMESKLSGTLLKPKGYQLWEHWSLLSRDPVDPATVGIYRNFAVWAQVEGPPGGMPIERLAVLRYAGEFPSEAAAASRWLSSDSFTTAAEVARNLLNWDGLTIRGVQVHVHLDWSRSECQHLFWGRSRQSIHFVPRSDGAVSEVVLQAERAAREVLA